jgi:uncharacterized membrane protein YebE (DUF533 family)
MNPNGNSMTLGAAVALLVNGALKRFGQPALDLDDFAALGVVATYAAHSIKELIKMFRTPTNPTSQNPSQGSPT